MNSMLRIFLSIIGKRLLNKGIHSYWKENIIKCWLYSAAYTLTEGSYARYYPMVRIQADTEVVMYIIKGIVLNDELYSYCCETETCPT